jgi:hypothetical protein
LGLEVVGYRYGPWREYRGEEGEYLRIDRRWERIGGVRKWMDVPLHHVDQFPIGVCTVHHLFREWLARSLCLRAGFTEFQG